MNEVRDSVKKDHPELKLGEVSKAIGERWAKLSDEQKKVCVVI